MKTNYFANLEEKYRITENAYQKLKVENKELQREKELYPPITTNPLLTLIVDKFGQKLYREAGRIAEVTNNAIFLKENIYFRIF